jgi:DNA polymerase III epsilon subunit-like protein
VDPEAPRSAARYRQADLAPLLAACEGAPLVVFDLETNGLSHNSSVVSCAALKYRISQGDGRLREEGRFLRYYFTREAPNPHAVRVHGLTTAEIARLRGDADYPRLFAEDTDFPAFCAEVPLFVAHNVDFDSAFVPFIHTRNRFCTMKSNARGKWPKLHEAARRYGVPVDPVRLHDSLYDAELAAAIFQAMIRPLFRPASV